MDKMRNVDECYKPITRGVDFLNKGDFNGLFILSKAGLGKSFQVDKRLDEIKADYRIFKGEISEAKFWEFIQENNGKILVFRDTARLLRRLSFIDTLKSMTENIEHRVISRSNCAQKEEGIKDEFEFKGKVLFEINDITKKYQEDLEALFTRGLFVELNLSREDIESLMFEICKDNEEYMVTDYLIDKFIGYNLNLRLQNMCFKIYEASKEDKLNWQEQIDLYLNSQIVESKKLLYRFAGYNQVRRIDFVKYLIAQKGFSFSTAERRIREYLILDEIFSDGKKKQAMISLLPINNNSNNSHF